MESGQRQFQVQMGAVGPGDEAHRPWPGPEPPGGVLFGVDHGRVEGKAEIAVRVHLEIRLVAAFETDPGPVSGPGGLDTDDHHLLALVGAGGSEAFDFGEEKVVETLMWHTTRV